MNNCTSMIVAFLMACATLSVTAEVRVIADYRLGEGGNQVTFAAGPDSLLNRSGEDHALQGQGAPTFIASAPSLFAGSGSLQFDGQADYYSADSAVFGVGDQFMLEAWASAKATGRTGLQGVVANGNGAQGYVLGQMGDQWVVFVGSVGPFRLGTVQPGEWTHLALVKDGNELRAYLNGRHVADISATQVIADQFRIGNAGLPTEGFAGMIHRVRVAHFEPGTFDADADFLVDYASIRRIEAEATEKRVERMRAIAERPGVQIVERLEPARQQKDWLIHKIVARSKLLLELHEEGQAGTLMLTNGLIDRSFYLGENLVCTSYRNLSNQAQYVRAVEPEARVQLDGIWYPIGGLTGQQDRSYLLAEWIPGLQPREDAFRFAGITVGEPVERYPWQQKFNAVAAAWPPEGLRVTMHYVAPPTIDPKHQSVTIDVHYEIYDGIPVMCKSFTVHNGSDQEVIIDSFESEVLSVNPDQIERIHAESDYSFHLVNMSPDNVHALGDHSMAIDHNSPPHMGGGTTTKWDVDPLYDTFGHPAAIEDEFKGHDFRNRMTSRPPMGPARPIAPGDSFNTFHTFELLQDSDDVNRRSLGVRRMYRTIAPQVTEHLLTATTPNQDPAVLLPLMDQMHELGFEHFNVSFWPGISHDNLDPAYIEKWKGITDYARERDIIVSGYELMVAARSRGAAQDTVDPVTGRPGSPFGSSLCLGTEWADAYFDRLWTFFDQTGFRGLTPDGPYHGCPCGSHDHAYHRGLEDSQWVQWEKQVEVFHEAQRRNIHAPAPDWYFLNGQTSVGMGYREASANLSREQALLLYQQYIYDGTWFKTPSMGQMAIGLIPTYNADPKAILEPLNENLEWYELHMVQLLASGAQPSFRANRLYDTPETKAVVQKWVGWFKQYRDILTSDLIHVQRPDGRDMDMMLHVNPHLEEKGMAIFFNPLNQEMTREFTIPLYYTGLEGSATLRKEGGEPQVFELDKREHLTIQITLPPKGITWYVIEE